MISIRKAALASGAAAAAVLFTTTAAMADTPVVTVGGSSTTPATESVTATNSGNLTFETNYDVPMTCTTSALTGTVVNGAPVVAGSQIGEVDSLSFSGCTATSLGFVVTVSNSGNIYPIVATGGPNADGTVPIEIEGVTADVSGNSCNFGASGTVSGTFTPGSSASDAGTISISDPTSAYPLTLSVAGGGSTCGGQVYDGDQADMTGTFDLSDTDGAIDYQ